MAAALIMDEKAAKGRRWHQNKTLQNIYKQADRQMTENVSVKMQVILIFFFVNL